MSGTNFPIVDRCVWENLRVERQQLSLKNYEDDDEDPTEVEDRGNEESMQQPP